MVMWCGLPVLQSHIVPFQTVLTIIILLLIDSTFAYTRSITQPIWNSTYTDKLRQDLLLNYDKFSRPTQHYNATPVNFGLSIRHLEVNEFKSSLTVYAWMRLVWQDDKLQWNATDYGDLNTIHMADHEIWQPDIFVYNSATSAAVSHYGTSHCIVYENGRVLWVPPTQFTVLCELNLKYWPFDSQQCSLVFGSWTHSGEQIDLQSYNNETEAKLELLISNTDWNLMSTSVERHDRYYDCCAESYPDITINLALKRNPGSYKTLIITPALVIIILILAGFWLPPQAGEKVLLNGCTAIIICLFLLYFTQKVPIMTTYTPLIVYFYSSSLYMTSFSLIASVAVIWISRTQHSIAVPWLLRQPLDGPLGRLLCLQTYITQIRKLTSDENYECANRSMAVSEDVRNQPSSEFEETNAGTSDDLHIIRNARCHRPVRQQEWILVAVAIDRLCFCFYCVLFAILSMVYSL